MRNIIWLLILTGILLTGCADNDSSNWSLSPTFTYDNMTLHGTEEKFGMNKVNGESDEPEFPVNKGRQYNVYFLESIEDFNGKRYKMTATHQNSDDIVELYEWQIDNKQSGAKFALDKEGLWKIDILVDDEPYTSFIVEAK